MRLLGCTGGCRHIPSTFETPSGSVPPFRSGLVAARRCMGKWLPPLRGSMYTSSYTRLARALLRLARDLGTETNRVPFPSSSQATRSRGSHSSCSGWDKYVQRNTARDFLWQPWATDLFTTLCLSSSFCFVFGPVHLPIQRSGGAEQQKETCTE